jgi:CRP-like cAMP-binding protein
MIGFQTFRKSTTISPQLIEALSDRYSEHELRVIDRTGTVVTIDAGSTFVHEGASGREALLILDGTAAVSRQGEAVATVGRGDVVGETAILHGQPRNASLIATTPLTAVVFSSREFVSVLDACPRLNTIVRETAEERLAA